MVKMQWYVVQATTNMENKVVVALKEKITQKGMDASFGEILFPQEEVVVHVNGKRTVKKKKVFPGYILVQMVADAESLLLVKDIPKVLRFMGQSQTHPQPITDEEAENMLRRQKEGFHAPVSDLTNGDKIKVISGAFTNFNGVVEQVDGEKLKVIVTVFGRPTSLELKCGDVQKVLEK